MPTELDELAFRVAVDTLMQCAVKTERNIVICFDQGDAEGLTEDETAVELASKICCVNHGADLLVPIWRDLRERFGGEEVLTAFAISLDQHKRTVDVERVSEYPFPEHLG